MSMDRGNPFRHVMTLREAMDRLLEDGLSRSGEGGATVAFPVDVLDHDERFIVHASLPGVGADDVHVQIQGETLTIRAEISRTTPEEGARWIVRERPAGTMLRSLGLPAPVLAEQAAAGLENGVLTLTLPKVQRTGPHQIRVGRREATQQPAASESSASSQKSGRDDQNAQRQQSNPSIVDATKPAVAPDQSGTRARMTDEADTPPGDKVTVESEESFPASDPPSWTPERS